MNKKLKVTLVNANLIQEPAVAPYALDILATSLTQKGHEVKILDLTPKADNWKDAISKHFEKNNPDYIGISLRNMWDLYFPSLYALQEQGSFIPSHQRIVGKIAEYFPREKIIAGGIGFSIMPQTILKKLELKYGVVGAGEMILPRLLEKLSMGEKIDDLPFVEQKNRPHKVGLTKKLDIPINRKDFINNRWYYENGEYVGIRTNNGCSRECVYCPEKNVKGNLFSISVKNILSEIEQLVEQGVRDIHINDSELNLPFAHSKEIARAIIREEYPQDLNFWSYVQINPFDEKFAELWKKAGMKGMLFGTDHTDEEILKKFGKTYNRKDIEEVTRICNGNGIAVMHELLFGMYGDNTEKMKKSIEFLYSLNPHAIGTTVGIGIHPNTNLSLDKKIIRALSEKDKEKRIKDYGIYCYGTPLEDPTYLVDPSIKIPEVYSELQDFVGGKINQIMIPTLDSISATNNQLVGSDRIKNMKQRKQKGSHWYHYHSQFEK